MLSNTPLPSVIGQSTLVNCVHFFCFSKGFSVCFEGLFCLYYLWGFVIPSFLLSSPSHTNPVKKLVTSGFLYAAGIKLRSGKLKSGVTRQCSAACRDVGKVGFWNTLQSLLWDISSQCDTTGFDDDKHPVLTDCPW